MKKIKYLISYITILSPSIGMAAIIDVPKTGGPEDLNSWIGTATTAIAGTAAAIAVVIIVIGGIQYMTAQSEEGTSAAKSRITNGIIGLIIIALATGIIKFIQTSLNLQI